MAEDRVGVGSSSSTSTKDPASTSTLQTARLIKRLPSCVQTLQSADTMVISSSKQTSLSSSIPSSHPATLAKSTASTLPIQGEHATRTTVKRKADLQAATTTSTDSERFGKGSKFKSFESFEASFNKWHPQEFPDQRIWTRKAGPNAGSPRKVCSNEEYDSKGNKFCSFRIMLHYRENSSKMLVAESHLTHSEACLRRMANRSAKRVRTSGSEKMQLPLSVNKATPSADAVQPPKFLQIDEEVDSREAFENQLSMWHEQAFPGKTLYPSHYTTTKRVTLRYKCNQYVQTRCGFSISLVPLGETLGHSIYISNPTHSQNCQPARPSQDTTSDEKAASLQARSASQLARLQPSTSTSTPSSPDEQLAKTPANDRPSIRESPQQTVPKAAPIANDAEGPLAAKAPHINKEYKSFKRLEKSINKWHASAFIGGDGLCVHGEDDKSAPFVVCKDYELKKCKCRFRINFKLLNNGKGYAVTAINLNHASDCRVKPIGSQGKAPSSSTSIREGTAALEEDTVRFTASKDVPQAVPKASTSYGSGSGTITSTSSGIITATAAAAPQPPAPAKAKAKAGAHKVTLRAKGLSEKLCNRLGLHGIKTEADLARLGIDKIHSGEVFEFVLMKEPFAAGNSIRVEAFVGQLVLAASNKGI